MTLEPADVQIQPFSNSAGVAGVRVTHPGTATSAESIDGANEAEKAARAFAEVARRVAAHTAAAAEPEEKSPLTTALSILGAFAGLTTIVFLSGATTWWLRAWRAGLPEDELIALLPRELVLVTGFRKIVLPMGIAIAVAVGSAYLGQEIKARRTQGDDRLPPGVALVPAYLLTYAVSVLIAFATLVKGEHDIVNIIAVVSLWVVSFGIVLAGISLNRRAHAGAPWSRFTLPIMLVAAASAFAFQTARAVTSPLKLPPARVTFNPSDGGGTVDPAVGFYLGATAEKILLATDLCARPSGRSLHSIVDISRGGVREIRTLAPINVARQTDREQAQRELGACGHG